MILDPQLRAAVEAAYQAWQRRQEQLALDLSEGKEEK